MAVIDPAWTDLLQRNSRWAAARTADEPDFFARIASEHRPRVFYVGCSDARVPANLVTDAGVGELFVHRNVANQVLPVDASLAAGLEYAVEVLGVEDVIVCGHRGCGGVRAALGGEAPARVDAWISPLRLLARAHRPELDALDEEARVDLLVDLNVAEQVASLRRHPAVRGAWAAGRSLRIHGWVYDLPRGLILPRLRVEGEDRVHAHPEAPASWGADAHAK